MLISEILFFDVTESALSKIPIYILLLAYIGMFGSSTYLHIYFCHSEKTNKCVIKADYCGIA